MFKRAWKIYILVNKNLQRKKFYNGDRNYILFTQVDRSKKK